MADESGAVDYLEQSLRSIYKAKGLMTSGTLEMNENLCRKVLGYELQVLEDFLLKNWEKLLVKDLVSDRRRVTLLHLYPVVKQIESLVRQCCESADLTWSERALSVCAMKEDVLDIVVHLRWWTSIVDIVIDSAVSLLPNSSSAEQIEAKRLEFAGRQFEETLNLMALFDVMDSTRLDEADRKALVKSKMDAFKRIDGLAYGGELGTKEHLEFLLSWPDRGEADMAEQPFKHILVRCIELHKAALEDKEHLVNKALDLMGSSFAGDVGSREHHAYLLAKQVYSLLTDEDIDDIPQLNEWHHIQLVGHGAFGVVNRVKWCGLDCVLKQTVYNPDRSEAKALKRFSHPHIVKFYRHFVAHPGGDENHSPLSHIVMERMPFDLKHHLGRYRDRSAPFPVPVAVDIMLQLAKAMWHMHSRSVVHRDLKPGNVLVESVSDAELAAQGFVHVKLVDFGLVRENILSSHPDLLMSYRAGSTLYRAPELSLPNPTVTESQKRVVPTRHPHKADLWSFAVMSSEILTGDVPFSENPEMTLATLLEMIQNDLRPRLPNDCPDYLRLCIERCWRFDPLERPRFADVWRMLRIAKLWSVGLILNNNLDWFLDEGRPTQVVSPAPVVENGSAAVEDKKRTVIPARAVPSSSNKKKKEIFSLLIPAFLKFKMYGRPDKVIHDQGLSIHYRSCHKQPFKYQVKKVWPRDKNAKWKLDVIFFEGNVGGRQRLSCRDTWLQRDESKVFWPQDWLPQDVHNKKVRVLVLQYDISETGLEELVADIKRFLILSDRWSQDRTWKSPVVLVGHSLGCTVIEALVMDLEQTQRQSYRDASGATSSQYDETTINTARAFMCSLRGCFFYAYPSYGLVKRDVFLKEIFGGLTYSEDLFAAEFQQGSRKMLDRSAAFLKLAKHQSPQIRIMSLVEGHHTKGQFVVQRPHHPPEYDLSIENTLVLDDSNHIQICKPVILSILQRNSSHRLHSAQLPRQLHWSFHDKPYCKVHETFPPMTSGRTRLFLAAKVLSQL